MLLLHITRNFIYLNSY